MGHMPAAAAAVAATAAAAAAVVVPCGRGINEEGAKLVVLDLPRPVRVDLLQQDFEINGQTRVPDHVSRPPAHAATCPRWLGSRRLSFQDILASSDPAAELGWRSTLGARIASPEFGITPQRKVALVTGATGQDGSYLLELLLEDGPSTAAAGGSWGTTVRSSASLVTA